MIVAAAAIFANSMLLLNVNETSVATDEQQTDRQAQVLAREIARTGKNMILAKARLMQQQNPDIALENIVDQINGRLGGITQAYGGGEYTAKLRLTSAASFAVESLGEFMLNEHEIVREEVVLPGVLGEGTLEIKEKAKLHVEFLESTTPFCSAVYMQRLVPQEGSTGSIVYQALEPELIFVPGNNRDYSTVSPKDIVLNVGERINFILGVDADFSCEQRGMIVPISDPSFNYTRKALLTEIGTDVEKLQEGEYAMIQENPVYDGVWRIAFEDFVFPEDKLSDIKENGYGSGAFSWDGETYGGQGWKKKDMRKYWKLEDYLLAPDFNDQAFQIGIVPLDEEASWDGWKAFTNNGHGNNGDGVDSSNPGQGDGGPNGGTDESCDGSGECIDDENKGG